MYGSTLSAMVGAAASATHTEGADRPQGLGAANEGVASLGGREVREDGGYVALAEVRHVHIPPRID